MTEVFVGPAMRLHTKGTFLGKPFARDFDQPDTTDLRDAVVVGLARMGLLHNVIDLAQGNGPEHADGTVREWLQPHDFRRVRGGVTYQLRVSGKETSEVTLTIKSGLPQKRTMTVHFPNGDMRVTETYRFPVKR